MNIKILEIDKLTLYSCNPRENESAVDTVATSIKEYGWNQPIVVDKDFVIIAGHTRFLAAKKLGMNEVPVYIANNLSKEQVKGYRLMDNRSHENSSWDMELLKNELQGLDELDFDLEFTGFDIDELKNILEIGSEELEGEDDVPGVPEEAITKLGDLYELGEHFLMCGDSTDKDQVDKLMQGQKADMVFTDPPYGIDAVKFNQVGGGGETKFKGSKNNTFVKSRTYKNIENDSDTNIARGFYLLCKDIGIESFIIFGGNYFSDFLPPSPCWLIWDKENSGNFADVEMAWTSFDKGAKLYKWMWNGMARKGIRDEELKSRVHPTQKPVGLFTEIISDFKAEKIFDGFGGSGSTLIACEKLKRKCYMMEIDPGYCDVIVERYKKLFPEKEVCLLSGEMKDAIGAGSITGRNG